jgi:SAM-dependent methyltransferase
MSSVGRLEARRYPNHADDHVVFDASIRRYLRRDAVILDAGAGRGAMYPYDYGEAVQKVIGVDADAGIWGNPNLDEAVVADICHMPFADRTFDLVFSKYVVEHFARPIAAFREIRRVMKPGAHFLFHTPNRFHYVALGATLTPPRFHEWFNERRGRAHEDTFPTRYRANDRRTLGKTAARSGFRVVTLEMIEPKPAYLFFHPLAYQLGIAYERLVNSLVRFADLRCVIVADLEAV